MENALGNPDLIQSSVSSDCRVTIVDLANFPLDELEQWPTFRLTSADIKLKLGNGAYYVYIVVPTPENMESTVAFISYNTALVDRDGYQVLESTDEKGNPKLEKGELLGKSGFKYYQCGTVSARGGNSSAITTPSGQGRTLTIDLGVNPQDSHLDKKVDWNFFYSLFVPHYEDPNDPEKLTWIEAKAHMGIAGGLTSFIDNGSLKLPAIYDGLPIDYQTLYWDEIKEEVGTDEEGNPIYKTTKVLKAKSLGEGGEGGSTGGGLSAAEIKTLIESYGYLTESKLPIASDSVKGIASFNSEQFSVINGVVSFIGSTNNIPDLSAYVTESEVNSLIKAAKGVILETWTSGGGNAITSLSLGIGGKSLVIEKNITFATEEWVLEMLEGLSGGGGGNADGTSLGVSIIGSGNAITDVNLVGNMLSFSKGTVFVEPSNFMSYLKYNSDTLGLNANGELYVKVSTGGSGGDTDLSQYATKDYVINTITSNISGLASKDWVMEQIAGLNGGGSGDFPDLSAYAEKTWVDENFASNDWVSSNFASLEGNNTFSGTNKFNGSVFVNNKEIKYNSKGYWELDGDLLVTGGITSFASSSGFTPSTIMDGVAVDGVTIIKQNGVLVAVGGGSSDGSGGGTSSGSLSVGESGSGNAYTGYTYLNGKLTLKKDETFATSSELSALEDSVANKADKSSVYTKTEIDNALTNYVTVKDDKRQTIEGEKNFTGGLFVNGKQIKYNSKGYWELEGDLLVTGGITSFASSSGFNPSTVMDGVVVDGTTIIKQDGKLVVVGGGSSGGSGSGDSPDLSAYALKDWVSLNFATSSQLSTLSGTVDNKANTSDVYTKSEVDTKVSAKWTTDSDKISQWDAAYGWGNHADVGYLTTTIGKSLFVGLTGDEDVQGVKNFVNGIEVNGGKLEYNSQGYWKMFGNLLVTGGITSYTSDGKESPFILDASFWTGINSDSATQVYSAKAVTLLKNEVQSVGTDAGDALTKLSTIKDALNGISNSSDLAALRSALLTIKTSI